MGVPEVYTKSAPVLVNFDFADILSDVGYITLFGINDEAGTKSLNRTALESTTVLTKVTGTSGNVEANFDSTINIAQLIKGDLFVSITIQATSTTGTSQNDTTIEIFHVDGASSETSIGTQQAIRQLNNPSSGSTEWRSTLTFDVNKQFAKGDKLRIEVISTVTSGNANSTAGFFHDGSNRDLGLTDQEGVTARSNLIVSVPFDLDF